MAEKSQLEDMGSDDLSLSSRDCEFDEKGTRKISVSDRSNTSRFENSQHDSFVIDMVGLSQVSDKQRTANSRVTLQRSLSRKMSNGQRSGEKKTGPAGGGGNDKDNGVISSSSPRATTSSKVSTPRKPTVVITPGTKDQILNPQSNHHITIVTSNIGSNTTTIEKRLAFRRSSMWTIDPRKILLFFASLSSLGTIILIYLTLSIRKLSTGDSSLE